MTLPRLEFTVSEPLDSSPACLWSVHVFDCIRYVVMLTTRRIRSLAARRPVYVPWSCCNADRRWSSAVRHDPLRVLFCGADPFSIASLKALNDVRLRYPGKVASIDVVCRPGKRAGRGLAQIRERKSRLLPKYLHKAKWPT